MGCFQIPRVLLGARRDPIFALALAGLPMLEDCASCPRNEEKEGRKKDASLLSPTVKTLRSFLSTPFADLYLREIRSALLET